MRETVKAGTRIAVLCYAKVKQDRELLNHKLSQDTLILAAMHLAPLPESYCVNCWELKDMFEFERFLAVPLAFIFLMQLQASEWSKLFNILPPATGSLKFARGATVGELIDDTRVHSDQWWRQIYCITGIMSLPWLQLHILAPLAVIWGDEHPKLKACSWWRSCHTLLGHGYGSVMGTSENVKGFSTSDGNVTQPAHPWKLD